MLRRSFWPAAAVLLFAALGAVILRLAWVSDDAYITLRTIENWLHGDGLCWNVGERAQTYTHPLWLLLLAAARCVGGEAYFATLTLGLACTLAVVLLLLLRIARTAMVGTVVLTILIASRSFTEFATSGLENPLVHLLLVLLVIAVTATAPGMAPRLLTVALLTSLLGTTRYDLLVIGAPVLLASMRGRALRQALGTALIGAAPLWAWTAFAAIYYGTPWPTTAYAKLLAAGVPTAELLQKGLFYLRFVATWDPITVVVIAAGVLLGLWRGELRCRALALGALLHCCYVVRVGGDFMAGRFLTPAFVVALAIVARALATTGGRAALAATLAAGALLFAPELPPWLQPPSADQRRAVPEHGVSDERLFWYSATGLFSAEREKQPPLPGVVSQLLRIDGRTEPVVQLGGMAGILGFNFGALVHVVDPWLCDPLLMRLPTGDLGNWRIGHFLRRIPEGYLESVATGENHIYHPRLRRYYEALRKVQRLPLFAGERWRELLSLWLGTYDADLAAFVAEEYRTPPRPVLELAELQTDVSEGTLWFDDPRVRPIYQGGIAVRCDRAQSGRKLRALLTAGKNLDYTIRCRRGDAVVATVEVPTEDAKGYTNSVEWLRYVAGVHEFEVALPGEVEFDNVWIDAHGKPGEPANPALVPAIGGLHFLR